MTCTGRDCKCKSRPGTEAQKNAFCFYNGCSPAYAPETQRVWARSEDVVLHTHDEE